MKYRVGDKVRVKKNIAELTCSFGMSDAMRSMRNSVQTIAEIGGHYVRFVDDHHYWTENLFDPLFEVGDMVKVTYSPEKGRYGINEDAWKKAHDNIYRIKRVRESSVKLEDAPGSGYCWPLYALELVREEPIPEKSFKVSDKVRVNYDPEQDDHDIFTKDWMTAHGNIYEITMIHECGDAVKLRNSPGMNWWWPVRALERVNEEPITEEVYIRRDGSTVEAVYERDGEPVKCSKAVCSPEDEFVFEVGARLALERVFEPEPEPEPVPTRFTFEDFKADKFVVNCKTEEDAKVFLAYLQGKGITWSSGDKPLWRTYWSDPDQCYRLESESIGLRWGDTEWYMSNVSLPVIPFNPDDLD